MINTVFIVGVILAPIIFISAAFGFIRSLKNDKKDSFEIASSLQNSMYTMMTTMIMGMQRGGGIAAQQQAQAINQKPQQQFDASSYESWNEFNQPNGMPGTPFYHAGQPQLNNARATSPYMQNSQVVKNSGFLVGLLAGGVIFFVLALVAVLFAKY